MKRFSDGLNKLRREGAITASVRGPSDWKSLIRIHREVLNISLDPPQTKRILLKTKNFVNASLRRRPETIKSSFRKEASSTKKNGCKNPLALRKSCDIFAPVCISHFSDRRAFEQGLSGEGRESDLGVVLHGPHSSHDHLADHLREYLFFRGEDMVAASRSLRRGRQHRSSLHDNLYPHGRGLRCRSGCLGIPRLELS